MADDALPHSIRRALAAGDWAGRARLRAYGVIFASLSALALAFLALTGEGRLDYAGRPLGSDFAMVWTSGRFALAGAASEAWSLAAQARAQAAAFGTAAGLTPWHYPPPFLLVAAPLAALPYLPALLVWQGATFALYLRTLLALAPPENRRLALLLACAFPAVFLNLVHGQAGFWVAGVWTLGLLLLPGRPILAGLAFAALCVKPQFALLVPVLLIAGLQGRACLAAAAGSLALALAALTLFGVESWRAFLESLGETRRLTLELGATGFEKIQSPYAGLRLLGVTFETAIVLQTLLTLALVFAVAFIWRSRADARLKNAAALAATLAATPYALDYDLVLLAPALAWLIGYGRDRGFEPYEISFCALVFATPLLARVIAGASGAPLGPIVVTAFALWTVRRAWRDALRTSPAPPHPSAPSRPSP